MKEIYTQHLKFLMFMESISHENNAEIIVQKTAICLMFV